ncbi:response regulator [Scytonema sp. UIC 10036]|uniref:response regulator n=1 Tax=Scytonema sp. UIC 10036 TaxID=2304196 RepID=UPI0012DAE751|nr:response regulator [Scytonema sp. UIC 10036]MUG99081.1 response regulator [Scytonema sp. UIC 10036]
MVSKQILVIDDEELLQEVIQASLEEVGGWTVLLAGSGTQGLAIAATQACDAILLDVSMPGMDGLETFLKLQENCSTQAIPVILLTAKVQPEDKVRFSQLAIAGIITKPFDPITLTEQIADILGWVL